MVAIGIQPVFSISFKLLKRYSCEQWRSNVEQPEDETIECSSEIKGLSNLSDFKLVSHLVTNKELRLSGDLYVKCLISFLLTKLLQQSGKFFVNSSEEPITPTREDLLFTGQLLFLNILKISCNGFKLAEFQVRIKNDLNTLHNYFNNNFTVLNSRILDVTRKHFNLIFIKCH